MMGPTGPIGPNPIGMFDSGLGGLTVLNSCLSLLPQEDFIYFGDTARLPYGNKSASTICRYSEEIAQFLSQQDIKLLVVACNTASSYAIHSLKKNLNIPVIGVIEPAVKMALKEGKKRIGILGTRGTIASESYQKALLAHHPFLTLYPISCPLFVPLIEEGFIDHALTEKTIEHYLHPLKGNIDTLILGCTHYPLLADAIQNYLGEDVVLINSADSCAQEIKRVLKQEQIEKQDEKGGECRYFVTDDPSHFAQHARLFMDIKEEVVGVGCAMLLQQDTVNNLQD